MIELAARTVAAAEQTLNEAQAIHDRTALEVSALQDRLADLTTRMEATRAAFAVGDMTDQQAGGLYGLLDADRKDLAVLVASAEVSVTSSAAALTAAESKLAQAKNQLAQAIQAQRAAELADLARRLDARLCDTIGSLVQAGIQAGRPRELAAHWRPSERLSHALLLRRIPQVTQP